MTFRVVRSGVLSLLQDAGRTGVHRLGLSNGGPLDREAYDYCNRLLENPSNSTVVEISVGGLELECLQDTWICLTGADMPLQINGVNVPNWTVHPVQTGDTLIIGHARAGLRGYLGAADGFQIAKAFGSTSTVTREGVGGIEGRALQVGDNLPCSPAQQCKPRRLWSLPNNKQPRYMQRLTVRVVPGYQQAHFDRIEQRRFFGAPYEVAADSDRMGYRLQGSPVQCGIGKVPSEGIGFGAIQIPPDGQPIVLLNDRQTLGGYPKIGSALAVDVYRMTQLPPGGKIHFAPITPATARKALILTRRMRQQQAFTELAG